jgi:hypothetical protein
MFTVLESSAHESCCSSDRRGGARGRRVFLRPGPRAGREGLVLEDHRESARTGGSACHHTKSAAVSVCEYKTSLLRVFKMAPGSRVALDLRLILVQAGSPGQAFSLYPSRHTLFPS